MKLQSWLLFLHVASSVSYSHQWPAIAVGYDTGSVQQKNRVYDDQERSGLDWQHIPSSTKSQAPFASSNAQVPGPSQAGVRLAADNLTANWTPPLSTRGRFIVDANGQRFKLIAGNWHGASGTWSGRGDINDPDMHHAGEQAFQTPLCLDRVPIDEIVQSFLDLGMTAIRLPFSNEMIHSTSTPPDSALRENPQLRGMTPLEIFDACIAALTKRGLAVILNNHTVKSIWCCGVDVNARWNGIQSDQQWQDDWVFMMKRYRHDPRVVGAELYNEVRRDFLADPTWGSGTFADWWNASQTAGTRILREANADVLIVVEGINFVGIPTKYTTHYRPELQPVGQVSHSLPVLDKLVYSSHFYSYTGANATGGGDLSTDDPLYRELSPFVLDDTMRMLAFFVSNNTGRHYTAPVWISEFGSAGRTDYLNKDRWWWSNFTDLLIKYDADFSVWPLLGWQENGHGDGWAMHMFDSAGQRLSILDPGDWRLADFSKVVNGTSPAVFSGLVKPPVSTSVQLFTAQGSVQQSNRLHDENAQLSQPGLTRASCPDGLRLHGLSYDVSPSGLCTDATFGRNLWDASNGGRYTVITTEIPAARSPDWAKGLTKLQCPLNMHLIGYSFSDGKMESTICGETSRNLTASGNVVGQRTIYFGKQSNLAADRGQWYGLGSTAATCAEDELLIGVAFTTHKNDGGPQALLCQNFHGVNAILGTMGTNKAGATNRAPKAAATVLAAVGLFSVLLALTS